MFATAPTAPAAVPAIPLVTPVASGNPGLDLLVDLPGDTDLQCGVNQDVLLFQGGSGFDLVFGFDPTDGGDVIAIEENVNGTLLQSVEDIVLFDTEVGALVDLGGGNAFLLAGVSAQDLDANDFVIHPSISGADTAGDAGMPGYDSWQDGADMAWDWGSSVCGPAAGAEPFIC